MFFEVFFFVCGKPVRKQVWLRVVLLSVPRLTNKTKSTKNSLALTVVDLDLDCVALKVVSKER